MLLSSKFPVLLPIRERHGAKENDSSTCAGLVILGELTADNYILKMADRRTSAQFSLSQTCITRWSNMAND